MSTDSLQPSGPPPHARCWCVCNGQLLCDEEGLPLLLSGHQASEQLDVQQWLPVSPAHEQPRYVLILNAQRPREPWRGLRSLLGVLPDTEFALAGRALQLARWAEEHRFCHYCGAPLGAVNARALARGDYLKSCTACSRHCYPVIAPCVIVLVTRGRRCLLAYHQRARQPVYTALAGFIDPGETAEQALVREVYEEVGLEVDTPEYAGSQSWPFPGQLMLGFYARYRDGIIHPDVAEIIDADWYDWESLPDIPPVGTIARRLIDGFVQRCRQEALEERRI